MYKLFKEAQFVKRLSFLLACLFVSQQVSFAQSAFKIENECDSSLSCKFNSDNIIYKPFREFTYLLTTDVKPEDFGLCSMASFGYSSLLISGPLFLKIKVFPHCDFEQTMIRYEYISADTVFTMETTGVVEDKDMIWIHPPRDLICEVKYSPYFEYLYSKTKWRRAAYIVDEIRVLGSRKMIWATHKYTVEGDSLISFNSENILCKVIEIKTKHRGKEYYSKMLFSDQLGFVLIDVKFINGKSYSLKLIDVRDNYCK